VSEHAASGRATHVQRAFQAGDTDDAFLTIAATNDPDVNRAVAGEVLARNGLVSVATNPQQGNCSFMATVRRGPLTVGVHSGGAGPHVAIAIRAVVESALPENIEAVLDELSAIRAELRAKVPDAAERGRLWQAVARSGELENALSKGSRESLDSVRGLLNIRRP
jgi:siroheme synthase-like protein